MSLRQLAGDLCSPSWTLAVLMLAGGLSLAVACGDAAAPDSKPASISVGPSPATVVMGQTLQLIATVKDAQGTVLSGVTPTWTSSDKAIVGVSTTGLASGVAVGAATITATTGGVSGSLTVNVVAPTPASVSIGPTPAIVSVGQTLQLEATVKDGKGAVLSDVALTWTSSDASTVSVSANGSASAVATGAAMITASAGGVSGSLTVNVVGIAPTKLQRHSQHIWLGPNIWTGLYLPGAPWPTVQARTHVLKLYITDIAPDTASLAPIITTLNQAHVAVAVESGGLRPGDCSGASVGAVDSDRIGALVRAGGAISFVALDSPFGNSLTSAPEPNCGYTVAQAAAELATEIHIMRAAFPGVEIGIIEPVPYYSVGIYPPNSGPGYGDLPQLLDTFLSVLEQAHERIDFFHADSPYDYNQALPNGWQKLVALEQVVRGHGLRFGLIYNSDAGGTSGDQPFHDQTLAALLAYQAAGGNPDDLIVQSWYPHPSAMVPEDQAYTFTNTAKDVIAQYDVLYP
jgi:Big-like domain-containing protein